MYVHFKWRRDGEINSPWLGFAREDRREREERYAEGKEQRKRKIRNDTFASAMLGMTNQQLMKLQKKNNERKIKKNK